MRAAALSTRSFRNLADARIDLGAGLTVVHGTNGAGKTNLLESLFFALTGRSCRTRREREMVTFGSELARAEVELEPEPGESLEPVTMLASISGKDGRRRRIDGREVTPEDDRRRPALSVFMPDRLALVKGPPGPRRAHLDRLAAALWPARGAARADYARALAQRNALLARVRRGTAGPAALEAWDAELAARAVPLTEVRAAAAAELEEPFTRAGERLGLPAAGTLSYRPQAGERGVEELTAELSERREGDIARGFTVWGPHRDDVELRLGDRSLRRYGSQGQQRIGLLALLFAEREALRRARQALPLMLLDDVMSELDPERRARLVDLLDDGGQSVITATESQHVPDGSSHRRLVVEAGSVTAPGGPLEGAGGG
ncbi:MAG TPA: DNA replication and repair protein RecF [Solirubrobacterales bacterium]|nr:DNA replication and repair protein RecF [Solirubrobacterales bacterium]